MASQNVLEWIDNSTDETAFLIERKAEACALSALTFVQIATVGPNVVLYTDIAVTEGVTYAYRVRAQNANGASGYTNCADRLVPDVTPPTIAITSPTSAPTFSTGASTIALGGVAADNVGVSQVTWTNDRGGSGFATGTTAWSILNIGLQPGMNVLTVTASDAALNTASAVLIVTVAGTATLAVRSFMS